MDLHVVFLAFVIYMYNIAKLNNYEYLYFAFFPVIKFSTHKHCSLKVRHSILLSVAGAVPYPGWQHMPTSDHY